MKISHAQWMDYIEKLYSVSEKAGDLIFDWVEKHSYEDLDALIEYAYTVATKYGEGAAALAAEMYDLTAELSGKVLAAAIPAETATYTEVLTAVTGTAKYKNPKLTASSVSRLVKVAGVDTTMQNALRDGAEWAWIPVGETCAFCLTLASRDWQPASKRAIKKGHASHIHANCNCTYAVRFDQDTTVEGYEPEAYYDLYSNAEGANYKEKINSIRRRLYEENHYEIRTQQREAYHDRVERKKKEQNL